MFCWCLQIHTDDELVGSVLSDLSQRHGQILDIDHRQDHRLIHSLVPLSELVGYSTTLRTLTHGTATFSMEVAAYERMSKQDESRAVEKITGFPPL